MPRSSAFSPPQKNLTTTSPPNLSTIQQKPFSRAVLPTRLPTSAKSPCSAVLAVPPSSVKTISERTSPLAVSAPSNLLPAANSNNVQFPRRFFATSVLQYEFSASCSSRTLAGFGSFFIIACRIGSRNLPYLESAASSCVASARSTACSVDGVTISSRPTNTRTVCTRAVRIESGSIPFTKPPGTRYKSRLPSSNQEFRQVSTIACASS